MKILTLNSNRKSYNRMRDRISDLSQQYSLEDIVRIENLELEKYNLKRSVAEKTYGWAMTEILTTDERKEIINGFLKSLDIKFKNKSGDLLIGSSEDEGCCGSGAPEGKDRESFDDVEEMAARYAELEREGRDPHQVSQHGPGAWILEYDEEPNEQE